MICEDLVAAADQNLVLRRSISGFMQIQEPRISGHTINSNYLVTSCSSIAEDDMLTWNCKIFEVSALMRVDMTAWLLHGVRPTDRIIPSPVWAAGSF
jgi:hypothetical protein